jgi:alkanesulfonate monooxygenase SsuD/methylene tetrahydromethanopterin reductase-like flavin-dependent oxidoreductase (luciferase family)
LRRDFIQARSGIEGDASARLDQNGSSACFSDRAFAGTLQPSKIGRGATLRFGLDLAQQRMPWSELAARARFADGLGFDGIWGFDHFQPMYGEGPGECFEGNTTLAAWTGITENVRMGLLITGMTYRHPSVYAAEAITIDHASGGRLELAYGAAWFDKEHRELGIPFPPLKQRIDAFEEAVQIVRGLLTTDGFTFEGEHFRVHDATLRPRPVQQPHPPLWIGASGEKRMMPIAARYADVWHTWGSPESMREKSQRLSAMADAAGRDPGEITRASSLSLEDDIDTIAANVDAWENAGIEYLVCGWPAEGRAPVERFAKRFLAS